MSRLPRLIPTASTLNSRSIRWVAGSLGIVIAIVASILFREDLLGSLVWIWQWIINTWSGLSSTVQNLLTFIVTAIPIAAAAAFAVLAKVRSILAPKSTGQLGRKGEFPFSISVVPDELERLSKLLIGAHGGTKYCARIPPKKLGAFYQLLLAKRVLLEGRTGIGKTREVLEGIRRLAETTGEPFTIIIPHERFAVPEDFPRDVPFRNIILLLDNVHERYGSRGIVDADGVREPNFQEQLERIAAAFDSRFPGRFRIIATASDEPEMYERLNAHASFWDTFARYKLPPIHMDLRPSFVNSCTDHFALHRLEPEVLNAIVTRSDGTPAGIINVLANEARSGTGTVTLESISKYQILPCRLAQPNL